MSEETQMPLATHAPIEETTVTIPEPETPREEVSAVPALPAAEEPATSQSGETAVEEMATPDSETTIAEVTPEPVPAPVSDVPAATDHTPVEVPVRAPDPVTPPTPEPAEQVAAFTPQAPAPKDGQAPVQRLVASTTQTIVRGSEEAAKQSIQPGIAMQEPAPMPASAVPVTDLKSAILQSLNPKSFFPITHILRRYFGARFATQEAAKEARVLLSQLHDSRQIVVNHNRHMELARPFYTTPSPVTQYHTLDNTPLEAMLGVGVAK